MNDLGYQESVDSLFGLHRHGIKLGLDPILAILEKLRNPHRRYPTLHVGGTNGKGSTAAILASILERSGYRVGLYTSPHLVTFRERIRVNGCLISKAQVVSLTSQIRTQSSSALTFFEITTAMAFQHFADEHVDIAVIEVGMGGRWDATNVLTPLGVLITTIGYDHEEYLGDQLTDIAFEKAGIIKSTVPVVLGAMSDEAQRVIQDVAVSHQAPCDRLGEDFHVSPQTGETFHYQGTNWKFLDLNCALQGQHQMINAGCGLALLERLSLKDWRISESSIRSGLAQVTWEGRGELLQERPGVLIDGAHNPAAVTVLIDLLSSQQRSGTYEKLIFVVGMMRDKHHAEFLSVIGLYAHHLILTQASGPRAATVQELKLGVPSTLVDQVVEVSKPSDALVRAKELASPNDLICVTGSLFLAGEVRVFLKGSEVSCS